MVNDDDDTVDGDDGKPSGVGGFAPSNFDPSVIGGFTPISGVNLPNDHWWNGAGADEFPPSVCQHGRIRNQCKDSTKADTAGDVAGEYAHDTGSICLHGRRRGDCNECTRADARGNPFTKPSLPHLPITETHSDPNKDSERDEQDDDDSSVCDENVDEDPRDSHNQQVGKMAAQCVRRIFATADRHLKNGQLTVNELHTFLRGAAVSALSY